LILIFHCDLKIGSTAFIFGGQFDESSHAFPHITVNLETLNSSDPESVLPDFRSDTLSVTSVTATKDEIYIFGGYSSNAIDEIIKMNATTQVYQKVSVMKFNSEPGLRWDISPTSVWVEKLNRIYFFGGSRGYLIVSMEFFTSTWSDLIVSYICLQFKFSLECSMVSCHVFTNRSATTLLCRYSEFKLYVQVLNWVAL